MQGVINVKALLALTCPMWGFSAVLMHSYRFHSSVIPFSLSFFAHPFRAMPSYLFQKFNFMTVILCTFVGMIHSQRKSCYLNDHFLSDMNSCSLLLWEISTFWYRKGAGYLLCAWEILLNGKHVKMVSKININFMGLYQKQIILTFKGRECQVVSLDYSLHLYYFNLWCVTGSAASASCTAYTSTGRSSARCCSTKWTARLQCSVGGILPLHWQG